MRALIGRTNPVRTAARCCECGTPRPAATIAAGMVAPDGWPARPAGPV